jgi:hypothetical protein
MRGTAPSIKAWGGLSGREHADAAGDYLAVGDDVALAYRVGAARADRRHHRVFEMILALATRASLGHGGRVIRENGVTVAAYVCVIAAGIPRVFAGLDGKFG